MNNKYFYIVLTAAATMLAACSDNFLTQEPGGSTITEEQLWNMDDAVKGIVLGVYPGLYAYGGDHDVFGQRSIDMYGDLLCGDMALKTQNYGWFASDELMQTYGRRSYYWAYYYDVIRQCNKAINAAEKGGIPPLEGDLSELTDDQYTMGMYMGEVLTMRAWAYSGLLRTFTSHEYNDAAIAVPIYTEDDTRKDSILGAPRATCADVYLRIEEDFTTAIKYFETYNEVERLAKIEVNADVARILLAYAYLNKGDYTNALTWAIEAITKGSPVILPKQDVLTTGFNNVENNNWIWGLDVTTQNTTSLASFFGQCDIYSYSYASAGDIKGIDANLLKEIENLKWDKRELWFNNYYKSGKKNASMFQYAPDGKFYSATSRGIQADRDWLSDNVYMRWELAYLIAAEAACRQGDDPTAKDYLFDITDERVKDGSDADYTAWKATLTTNADLLAAIRYNWRVELWGEGYGLQTFRRFNEVVNLGENHLRSQKEISPISPTPRYFTFELPTSELYYNPYVRDTNTESAKTLKHKN